MWKKKKKKLQVLNHKAIVNTPCSSTITRTVPLPGLFQSAWILFPLPFPRMGWRRRLQSPIRLLYFTSTSWRNVTKVKKTYTSFTFLWYLCQASRKDVYRCFEQTDYVWTACNILLTGCPALHSQACNQSPVWEWGELEQLLFLGNTKASGGILPINSLVPFRIWCLGDRGWD